MAGSRTYRSRKYFDPRGREPFRVSRSKLDLFSECPRCAYLDLRLGVKRVQGPPFTLNNAVDHLLKKEFDIHRARKHAHPLMEQYGIDAVPFEHPDLEKWRHNFTGVSYVDEGSNFEVFGAIDDVWLNSKGELHIVDYKATAKQTGPSTTDDLYDSYKRQMEIYQWLFRKNGFEVSDTGYFVYVNGRTDSEAFDGKLEFDVALIPYNGDDSWVGGMLVRLRETLTSDTVPDMGKSFSGGPCDYCSYREAAGTTIRTLYKDAPAKARGVPKKDTLF